MNPSKHITYSPVLPDNSIIAKDFKSIDYQDVYGIQVPGKITIDEAMAYSFGKTPGWTKVLLYIRNRIVEPLGLKTEKEILKPENTLLFTILYRNETEVVLGEEDSHLDFRTSLRVEPLSDTTTNVYSSTLVHYNNRLGRIYFFFVKPFHKIIVKSMLKSLWRQVKNSPQQ